MFTFDEKPNRHSIRLPHYDYSDAGYYFVTICVYEHRCLFGEVEKGKMKLNLAGNKMEYWWHELKNKFKEIDLDEHIIMPNHFHGIIILRPTYWISSVGADLRVCPQNEKENFRVCPQNEKEDFHICPQKNKNALDKHVNLLGRHAGLPLRCGLPKIIQWFKTMTTNDYIRHVKNNHWIPFNQRLWQRNYYERIIRNERELYAIRNYVHYNAQKWEEDDYYFDKLDT